MSVLSLLFYQAVLPEFVLAIVIILGVHLDIFNLALVHSEVLRKFNHLIFTLLQGLVLPQLEMERAFVR